IIKSVSGQRSTEREPSMHPAFFPGPAFAWVYFLVLMSLLAVASYTDLRRLTIPKWVSLTVLALGLVVNVVRGAWLGSAGLAGWVLDGGGVGLGLLDGLLFALAGFALGFVLFFVLWLLGTVGGGDVKLFAALGAWIGPGLTVAVLAGTVLFL